MKKLIYYQLLLMLCVLMVACSDGTIGDRFADDQYGESGGTIVNYGNVVKGFFDLGDAANSTVGFDLTDFTGPDPSAVDVILSFRGVQTKIADGGTTFPSTHVVSMTDVLTAAGVELDSVEVGETCALFFDATNGSGKFRSENALVIPFSCESALAGTYDYVTTNIWCGEADVSGQATWTESSVGVYTIDDWGYGSYEACYGGSAAGWGTLTLGDVCNKITINGLDGYDDTWTVLIDAVSGADLTISWSNTYGEAGTTTLTRTDGTEWPPLSN